MLTALTIGCTAAYVLLAVGAVIMLARNATRDPVPASPPPFVSILVAARNEERVLARCLRALRRQTYPFDRIEFLVADDQSSDSTPEIVGRFSREDERFRLIRVPPPMGMPPGKAHALHRAIQCARGDLLLITDADCAPPAEWAANMAAPFQDRTLGVLCGTTVVETPDRLLGRVQALDWLLLLTTAAGASAGGIPITAMGNNMAVRRAAYDAVGGYPSLPFSVTEDYALFRAVQERTSWQVLLTLGIGMKNYTLPLRSLRAVFSQRKRWARGGLDAPSWMYAGFGIVYLAHLLPLAAMPFHPLLGAAAIVAKGLADLFVIRYGQRQLGERGGLRAFLAYELYLYAYIIGMPFTLLASPGIRWKGRRF